MEATQSSGVDFLPGYRGHSDLISNDLTSAVPQGCVGATCHSSYSSVIKISQYIGG